MTLSTLIVLAAAILVLLTALVALLAVVCHRVEDLRDNLLSAHKKLTRCEDKLHRAQLALEVLCKAKEGNTLNVVGTAGATPEPTDWPTLDPIPVCSHEWDINRSRTCKLCGVNYDQPQEK